VILASKASTINTSLLKPIFSTIFFIFSPWKRGPKKLLFYITPIKLVKYKENVNTLFIKSTLNDQDTLKKR